MILDFIVYSADFNIIKEGCYRYKIEIDFSKIENHGWERDEYYVETSYDSPLVGALQYSYSGVINYDIQNDDGSITTKSEVLWVNFISKI